MTRRKDSNVYQFGLLAPADLVARFPGKGPKRWAVRCSLGTADLREANDKARTLQAEWAARFDAMRNSTPPPVDLAALRAELLARVEAALPGLDEWSAGLAPEERAERLRHARWGYAEALDALKAGRLPEGAEVTLERWGYPRTRTTDAEAIPFLVLHHELRCEAIEDVTRTFPVRVMRLRDRRALVAATLPAARAVPAAARQAEPAPVGAGTRRMGDALTVWKQTGTRSPKTVVQFERHAALFAELAGDPPLAALRRPDAVRFRDALQAWAMTEGKTASTADNVLATVKALANVARDREWITGDNPFARLTVAEGGKPGTQREPWTAAELAHLFDDPIWTAYRLPDAPKAGAGAAYWMPLLGCFTGARISELAQLWTDDLGTEPGREVFEFRANESRGQRLKTSESWRAVPMHSELIRLGFLRYVATLKSGPLFPHLPTAGTNGPGAQFGQWFGTFKAAKGFKSIAKTFHSFRHLVATELRHVAPEALADAITGHAGQGTGRVTYSATIRRDAERLRPVIELLRYPSLRLPVVYPAAPAPAANPRPA